MATAAAAAAAAIDEASAVQVVRACAAEEDVLARGAEETADGGDRGPAVGIDLGTSFLVAAVLTGEDRGCVRVLPMGDAGPLLPTVVGYAPDGAIRVGRDAWDMDAADAVVAQQLKRIIGLEADSPYVKRDAARWDVDLDRDTFGGAVIRVPAQYSTSGERTVSPINVDTAVVSTARECIRAALHQPCTRAVVTVPSYFTAAQCIATKDAVAAAGIRVLELLQEPEAAAIAALSGVADGEGSESALHAVQTGRILVFDWGGGTCDVAVVDIEGGTARDLRVLATAGDAGLGGMDMDFALVSAAAQKLRGLHHEDAAVLAAIDATFLDKSRLQRALRSACDVKERLLTRETVAVTVPDWPLLRVTPADLAAAVTHLVQRAMDVVETALRECATAAEDITHVAYVGGVSVMTCVREALRAAFPGAQHCTDLDPATIVAQGAAIRAAQITGQAGCALTAAGTSSFLETVSVPIGIEAANGTVHPLVREYDATGRRVRAVQLSTKFNQQRSVALRFVRGFSPLARKCEKLGSVVLEFEEGLPAGLVNITVEATPRDDGVLQISVRESQYSLHTTRTLAGAVLTGLRLEDIRHMKEEAEDDRVGHAHTLALERRYSQLENFIATCRRMAMEPGVLPDSEKDTRAQRAHLDGMLQYAERCLAGFRRQKDGALPTEDEVSDVYASLVDHAKTLFRKHIVPAVLAAMGTEAAAAAQELLQH